MRGVRLRHRVEYAGLVFLELMVRALPERIAFAFGSLLGWLAGSVLRIRRGVVEENLARAFPDHSPGWWRRVAAASYRHLGREAVAMLRLGGMGRAEVVRRSTVSDFHLLAGALDEGKGALVLTGHLGNWEVAGAILASRTDLRLRAVARRQGNPLADRRVNRTRARLGVEVVEEGRAVRRVVDELRSGAPVALVADQNVRRKGVFVDFFDVPASTARGPALFALRSGAPVFLGAALAVKGRPGRYRGVVRELPVERTGDTDEDVRRLMGAYSRGLEELVREYPEQYFWQHKRWKTRPPEEPGQDR